MSRRTATTRNEAATDAHERPKKGRPPGSPNKDYAAGQATPSSCPECRSTSSRVLRKVTDLSQTGEHAGQEYNRIELHRVQCLDCPQVRLDRTYHFDPPADEADE